jgi:DNA adenine methylase
MDHTMIVPHPVQYQGSKRNLAPLILSYLPDEMIRLVEPFAGTAAVSLACAARARAKRYWLNEFNRPLAQLLALIINRPQDIARAYAQIWSQQEPDTLEHYYRVREDFNRTKDPKLFLYLLARCVKGAVRYNADGLFNQSPDKRRCGTRPETMRQNILGVSRLLGKKTGITSLDYRAVLARVRISDIVYMDPPYQGVCGDHDSRYFSGISHTEFIAALRELNQRGIRYAVSYDGRTGIKTHGQILPKSLGLTLIELEAGRSSQATLLGRGDITIESLYLSAPLACQVGAVARTHHRNGIEQLRLLETSGRYAKISAGLS